MKTCKLCFVFSINCNRPALSPLTVTIRYKRIAPQVAIVQYLKKPATVSVAVGKSISYYGFHSRNFFDGSSTTSRKRQRPSEEISCRRLHSQYYVVFLAWSQNGNGLGDEYALVLGGFNFFFLIADGEVVKLGGGPDDVQDCPNLTNLPKAVGTYFDKRAFLAQ